MRLFAEFQHEGGGRDETCCKTAAPEDLDDGIDEGLYDCQACPIAKQWAALEEDPANVEAWRLFTQCVTRFTVDTQTVALMLTRATADLDTETVTDLMARFSVLHDVLSPRDEAPE